MNKKQIVIQSIELIKEGVGKWGKNWKQYKIETVDNEVYKVFDGNMIAGMAVGRSFDIDFKNDEKWGLEVLKVYLPSLKTETPVEANTVPTNESVVDALKRIEIKIDRLLADKTDF